MALLITMNNKFTTVTQYASIQQAKGIGECWQKANNDNPCWFATENDDFVLTHSNIFLSLK